jgi:hypothetical protein
MKASLAASERHPDPRNNGWDYDKGDHDEREKNVLPVTPHDK